jgi:FkbM family methyltransferase
MTNQNQLAALASVERIATANKLWRMLNHPFKYFFAIAYRELIYPFSKKEMIVKTNLFNGSPITIALPASTDIYLTGGKSHDSEIRLAKFLIQNLLPDSTFVDIGAHYGYFSLIASNIVKEGMVYSFEPSSKTFSILQSNLSGLKNAVVLNKAVSDKSGHVVFYEFDNLHSEYNSTQVAQFENQNWFKELKPQTHEIDSVSLANFCKENSVIPHIIKIDVEGFENAVIKGGEELWATLNKKPIVVMEYLEQSRSNSPHKEALELLSKWGYSSNIIDKNGKLIPEKNIDAYLQKSSLDSDNIVFVA